MGVRDVLRIKGTPYKELGLDAAHWSDDELIDQMLAHPILINRPIVVSPLGVRLCRPSDMVIELLPQRLVGEIRKEDGTPLLVDTPVAGSDTGLITALQEAGLPTDDLAESGRSFFAYATVAGERVGYGGFERVGYGGFERMGLKPVKRASAPASVLATRQAASLCSASATLLRRPIHL